MVSLRSCLEEAKSAVLDGQYDRAVDSCSKVLESYPKHVEAHCLLGEALREKGLSDEAERVFLRVLSADPENLIARWALSILFEDRGDAAAALYHLERAFELSPGHSELNAELARLSEEPVFLSRLALARLYAKGELWEKVVDELRVISEQSPGRLDVMVPMAEALWKLYLTHGDKQSEDARALREQLKTVCEQVLDDSPDCLKANIILGHVLAGEGGNARARAEALLACASALDPEGRVEAELLRGAELPGKVDKPYIRVPELEPTSSDQSGSAPPDGSPSDSTTTLDREVQLEATRQEVDSPWDDLLSEDITLDEIARSRLNEAIARVVLPDRRTASIRSVIASLEPVERPRDEAFSHPPDAGSGVAAL